MSSNGFVILAYALGLGLLWGYAVMLFFAGRSIGRREQCDGGKS